MDKPPGSSLNGVMIIPTGLACALGGDAAYLPGIKLIASCVNKLIVNPNAVNASDINEMPSNCLYTEGSTIDRFLAGYINLKETKTYNKILCVINPPTEPKNINAINAGIWGLGADITLLELEHPLTLSAFINEDGSAGGEVLGWKELVHQVRDLDFDVLTILTPIDCDAKVIKAYWEGRLDVNPWGAVESKLSKLVSSALNKQAVHSPTVDFEVEESDGLLYNKIVVSKYQAPEMISLTFAFCMFKGSHRAPTIDMDKDFRNLSNTDINFLLTPIDCWGPPHEACFDNNIPLIIVRENTTCFKGFIYPEKTWGSPKLIFVQNYLEAAGVIMAMNAGVHYKTITLN